ncbi:MAG TPA: thioredoxin family protein [Candidatus Krumholzibacteria bacterium]
MNRFVLRSAVSALVAAVVIAGAGRMTLADPPAVEKAPAEKAATTAALNEKAPDFSLTGIDGKTYSLSSFAGKYVVLEWNNLDCPFVKKHYGSGNMQTLQKKYTDKGVVWLTICSSASGKQGYYEPAVLQEKTKEAKLASTAYLRDVDGTVGKLYGAKTTPHMFVINPEGVLVYAGAIDDKPSPDPADIAKSSNYVAACLDESMAGKPVATSSTASYGCSVKYAN